MLVENVRRVAIGIYIDDSKNIRVQMQNIKTRVVSADRRGKNCSINL